MSDLSESELVEVESEASEGCTCTTCRLAREVRRRRGGASEGTLVAGRWYWWMGELLRLADATTGACENMQRQPCSATLTGFKPVTAVQLDDYQDQLCQSIREEGSLADWDQAILIRLEEVRVANGLPGYRGLDRAIARLGEDAKPSPGWRGEVQQRIKFRERLSRLWRALHL